MRKREVEKINSSKSPIESLTTKMKISCDNSHDHDNVEEEGKEYCEPYEATLSGGGGVLYTNESDEKEMLEANGYTSNLRI